MIRLMVPEIGESEIAAVGDVLRSGFLVQGSQVREFERMVAEYVGVKHAIAVSSGTAALHLALITLGIGPGDEVIVPDFTFPATANVVEVVGAKPVLVDIDLHTYNVDPKAVAAAITNRTKAIMPVHLFGQSADMDPIMDLATAHDLAVIEDAACALGADYHGMQCGAIGLMACFSFHPRKVITTGEGGMITTNDDHIAEQLRRWRNHGMVPNNGQMSFELAGLNYRLTDFQGALGAVQMGRLDELNSRRAELAGLYQQALAIVPWITRPAVLENTRHIWQSYVVLVDESVDRDSVLKHLRTNGIEANIGTYAISTQPHYAKYGRVLPRSVEAYRQSLCLPLHTQMSTSDIEEVVGCLEQYVQ